MAETQSELDGMTRRVLEELAAELRQVQSNVLVLEDTVKLWKDVHTRAFALMVQRDARDATMRGERQIWLTKMIGYIITALASIGALVLIVIGLLIGLNM